MDYEYDFYKRKNAFISEKIGDMYMMKKNADLALKKYQKAFLVLNKRSLRNNEDRKDISQLVEKINFIKKNIK